MLRDLNRYKIGTCCSQQFSIIIITLFRSFPSHRIIFLSSILNFISNIKSHLETDLK